MPTTIPPQTVLQNRYTIVEPIANGGMGAVYLARDRHFSDNEVALKQPLLTSADLEKAFEREASILRKLRHQALPNVIDYFFEAGSWFLVMDYCDGQDLGDLLNERKSPFRVDQGLAWLDQLLAVLEYLHAHEPPVVHRDIKPKNLKLSPRGEIILLDFGLAKGLFDVTRPAGRATVFGYTPHFASPEQVLGYGTDVRSDIYSVGATAYCLLVGEPPPMADARVASQEKYQLELTRPAHEMNPEISTSISELLTTALKTNPRDRFQSASEFRTALRRCTERAPEPPPPSLPKIQVERPVQNSPLPPGSWLGIDFVLVPSGEFEMGSESGYAHERPAHVVKISESYYFGRTQVTQAQWRQIMGTNPSRFRSDDRPVEQITWNLAHDFCMRLNALDPTGHYRLPTEAEWEYACGAGGGSSRDYDLPSLAWFADNSNGQTQPVGTKGANAWGLHDMLGNVYEWCEDWYQASAYATLGEVDPAGPSVGTNKVVRGGSWKTAPARLAPTDRHAVPPNNRSDTIGLRLVRERAPRAPRR